MEVQDGTEVHNFELPAPKAITLKQFTNCKVFTIPLHFIPKIIQIAPKLKIENQHFRLHQKVWHKL